MKIKITSILVLIICNAFSQGEFVLNINYNNGTYLKVGPVISPVTYVISEESAFNQNNGTYFFISSSPDKRLYSINSTNGNIDNNPLFSDNIYGFEYNKTTNILYAIKPGSPTSDLINFNVVNGNVTPLGISIPQSSFYQGDFYTIDSANNKYIFFAPISNKIYVINLNTNVIESNTTITLPNNSQLANLSFNNQSNILYGIIKINYIDKNYLVSINLTTGLITQLGNGASTNFGGGGTGTINENDNLYIYNYGNDSNHNKGINVMNLNTGNLVNNVIISPLDLQDNVNSIEYDNFQNKLFGLHWDSNISLANTNFEKLNPQVIIYPNPINDESYLEVINKKDISEFNLTVYDSHGTIVISENKCFTNKIKISKENLLSGIYIYKVDFSDGIIKTGKIIIN